MWGQFWRRHYDDHALFESYLKAIDQIIIINLNYDKSWGGMDLLIRLDWLLLIYFYIIPCFQRLLFANKQQLEQEVKFKQLASNEADILDREIIDTNKKCNDIGSRADRLQSMLILYINNVNKCTVIY